MTAKERAKELGVSRATYFRHKQDLEREARWRDRDYRDRQLKRDEPETDPAKVLEQKQLQDALILSMSPRELADLEICRRSGLQPFGRNERGVMYR